MVSFSKKVKEQLSSLENRKKCCSYTEKAAAAINIRENCTDVLKQIWDKCRCDGCRTVFIRSVFILCGSITDPEKAYHLDFSFNYPETAALFSSCLEAAGYSFKTTTRKNKTVVYTKNSAFIEDFLVYIGASAAAFDLMNSKILHEFKNSVNREVNCDTANIKKQLAAGKRYTEAIEYLEKNGKIDMLSSELKETARMKLKYSQVKLEELGSLMEPAVTKSGMRHRLDRILDIAVRMGYREQ